MKELFRNVLVFLIGVGLMFVISFIVFNVKTNRIRDSFNVKIAKLEETNKLKIER